MARKVIKLTESDLKRIVEKVLKEQSLPNEEYVKMANDMLRKSPKPSESGAKYCFTKNDLVNDIKMTGADYIRLYKIKSGDSLGKLQNMTMQTDHMFKINKLCNLKDKNGLRVNDVIALSLRESQ